MSISPLAGKPAPKEMLIDPVQLEREYFESRPDLDEPSQLVSFGTSGHRGSPLHGSFTEAHILAITQAICDYRKAHGTSGPLFMGKDTHALSGPAQRTALEVLAANGVETIIQQADGVMTMPSARRSWRPRLWTRIAREIVGVGVNPSSRWMTVSTLFPARTSSAVRCAGPDNACVSLPIKSGPLVSWAFR